MKNPVARRYAQAFLELGIEHGKHREFQTQLRELATSYRDSEAFRALVHNPSFQVTERRETLKAIGKKAGWDPLMVNLTLLLLDKHRMDCVEGISEFYDDFVDQHEGILRARVSSAAPLKDSQVASIKGAIAKMTGKDVVLETDVDEDLIGGIVTRIGDTVYDGSVRKQLSTLRDAILESA